MPYKTVPLSRYIRRKLKKLRNLAALAAKLNLSVAIKQRLRNQLLGFDSVKRKLFLVKREKNNFQFNVIDLQEVEDCLVKKDYGSIEAGDLETNGLNHYLKSITLQLGLKGNSEPLSVNFYESDFHSVNQQSHLEASAKKWESFVSEQIKIPAA